MEDQESVKIVNDDEGKQERHLILRAKRIAYSSVLRTLDSEGRW